MNFIKILHRLCGVGYISNETCLALWQSVLSENAIDGSSHEKYFIKTMKKLNFFIVFIKY